MATYDELLTASQNEVFLRKIRVACVIAAETARTELNTVPNHVNRLAWAKAVFTNPEATARQMVWAVLAQNKGAAIGAITGASDATVQNAVDSAIDVFATAVI